MSTEKTRNGCSQSDRHGKCFKGSVQETSERWGGANNCRIFQVHIYHREQN